MANELVPASGALMSFIERAAVDPNFDVAKFGELLRLQRDVMHDQARQAFNVAMAQAQAEMQPVVRDAKNSHLNNKYAKLETIDAAIRPVYTRHGFSVRYGSAPAPEPGLARITCTVAHNGGYFEEQYLDAPMAGAGSQGGRTATTPVQAVGSTITYLRRYLLAMVFNVTLADDDDDGEAARRSRPDTRRDDINRDVPLRTAAAATPRGERVAADPLMEQDGRKWLENLRTMLEAATSQAEIEEIAAHKTVGDALIRAPAAVKRDISALLAENHQRLAEEEAEPSQTNFLDMDGPGDGKPDAGPEDLAIAGEEKLMAG